ncbi:MAG TPA: pyridoxamine 5'-phosphate oxidase family protein [Actinomycetota bacterium]
MRSTLTEAEREFVRWSRVARVATLGPGGPHVVPISPVLDGDAIVFATEEATAKVRNVRSDSRVSLVFDDYVEEWNALRQVIVSGTARVVEPGPEWERGRSLLYAKYLQYEPLATIGEADTVMVHVSIDRVVSSGF